ncbi:VMA8 [Malassezia furfur]|nr:VMA8 [Malassezia furfur]
MSSSGQREAVFATRQTLGNTKLRLKGAQNGHSLLKRKADALSKRFRTITSKIQDAKQQMGKVLQLASFSMVEVSYATGDIGYAVRENVKHATFRVRARQENISGVHLPSFAIQAGAGDGSGADESSEGRESAASQEFSLTGLSRGGQQVQKARDTYRKALKVLVDLASLQTAFVILDEVIRLTNRRVNAIEHVIIPRLENTIAEFFRLKKVQGKKKREAAQEAAKEGQPKTVDDTDAAEVVEPPAGADGPGDLVSGDKDTDVIF